MLQGISCGGMTSDFQMSIFQLGKANTNRSWEVPRFEIFYFETLKELREREKKRAMTVPGT
jgi:hypothetical protein